MSLRLLSSDEPSPVVVEKRSGDSPFLILCDHGGKRIPKNLGSLGLSQQDIERHIGWDIGVLEVSQRLSQLLNATLVHQLYSRLVIDCNRQPGIPSSIPLISESTRIPGNQGLTDQDRGIRRDEIFAPYHTAIREVIEERHASGLPTCVLAMHSFTPVFHGEKRPWEIGILYERAADFATIVMAELQKNQQLCVGDNQPYSVSEETDYAVPQHAIKNNLPYVEIEIRQDLISASSGQQQWAEELSQIFTHSWHKFTHQPHYQGA